MCCKSRPNLFLTTIATIALGGSAWSPTEAGQPNDGPKAQDVSPIRIEPVTDIWPGRDGSAPGTCRVFRGELYFSAHNRHDGRDIWRYDGHRAEIAIEGNLPAFEYGLRVEAVFNDRLYYTRPSPRHIDRHIGRNVEVLDLWEFDGKSNRRIEGVHLPAGSHLHFTEYRGELYFRGHDSEHGIELWKFDGQDASLVQDIKPGKADSEPEFMTVFRDHLHFLAWGQDRGFDFWRSDGKTVELVVGIDPRQIGEPPSSPFWREAGIVYRDKFVFSASNSRVGYELFAWDGKRLSLLANIRPGPDSSYCGGFCVYQNDLYFQVRRGTSEDKASDRTEIWKYDGDKASFVVDGGPDVKWTAVSIMGTWDEYLILIAEDEKHGMEPWYFDGKQARMIADVRPGVASSRAAFGTTLGQHGIGVGHFDDRGLELFRLVKIANGRRDETSDSARNQ